MRVHVYHNTLGDAPAGHEFIARIQCEMTAKQGKPVIEWHPVLIAASTADGAAQAATDWWAAEVEKARKAVERGKQQAARMREARQSKDA